MYRSSTAWVCLPCVIQARTVHVLNYLYRGRAIVHCPKRVFSIPPAVLQHTYGEQPTLASKGHNAERSCYGTHFRGRFKCVYATRGT